MNFFQKWLHNWAIQIRIDWCNEAAKSLIYCNTDNNVAQKDINTAKDCIYRAVAELEKQKL